ncbi:unnamed protein product [Arabis nemorensis]|uniref:60S ribosomal protein L7a n=1 Tax=Arabis nemorensis TaxID=586526 RepID=A0A565BLA5_9BRAS|nr:unnamed protein product [Arabis nemorensis]
MPASLYHFNLQFQVNVAQSFVAFVAFTSKQQKSLGIVEGHGSAVSEILTDLLQACNKGVKVATKKKQALFNVLKAKATNPLFDRWPNQSGIGGALLPKKDLTRYFKWPKANLPQRHKNRGNTLIS